MKSWHRWPTQDGCSQGLCCGECAEKEPNYNEMVPCTFENLEMSSRCDICGKVLGDYIYAYRRAA